MLKITTSSPDREAEFGIVIRISIGAGETCEVRSALEWSLVDRREALEIDSSPSIDTYWDGRTDAAARSGHSSDILLQTLDALKESLWESKAVSRRGRETSRAIAIVERALGLAQNTLGILASERMMASVMRDQ